MTVECPYCEKPLSDEQAACCGEVGHGVVRDAFPSTDGGVSDERLADRIENVAYWLNNGCEPRHAATELRMIVNLLRQRLRSSAGARAALNELHQIDQEIFGPAASADFDPLENFAQWCLGASPDDEGMVQHIIDNARGALAHAAEIKARKSPGEPSAEPCSNYDVLAGFADWLCREMPKGTVIGDPRWWAPRLLRAVEVFQKSRGTSGEPSGDYEWMKQNPDECASAVADAYENWEPGDPERGNWAECLAHEIEHQKSRLARFGRGSKS